MIRNLLMGGAVLTAVIGFGKTHAAPVTYVDNEAGFQAALGGAMVTVESFETTAPVTGVASLDTGPFRVDVSSGGLDVANFALPGTDGVRWLRVHTTEFPTLFVFDNPINAFAVDLANIFTFSGGSLSYQIDGGTSSVFLSQGGSGERNAFFGVIDSGTPFTTIAFSANISIDENLVFDRVQYAETAVPEPTSMALFGLTALGFGVGFRRRRNGETVEEIA